MKGVSRARKPPQRWEARRADILEVSRMGSHEVSEALVSKRATREAEREEMGYWDEPKRGSRAAEGESLPPGIGNVAPEPALKKWAGLLSLCDLLLLMSPEVQKLFCDSC